MTVWILRMRDDFGKPGKAVATLRFAPDGQLDLRVTDPEAQWLPVAVAKLREEGTVELPVPGRARGLEHEPFARRYKLVRPGEPDYPTAFLYVLSRRYGLVVEPSP